MITFEDRAVAFIDIMGFTPLVDSAVDDATQRAELSNLVELLEKAVPLLNIGISGDVPTDLIPKHTYISDCIIISTPLKSTLPGYHLYDGLEILSMRVSQLTHFFLRAGYLIRGGIDVGKAWHTGSNIVGPAYQNAYKLEENGKEPIVVLSESACKIPSSTTRIRITHNGKTFVNGLNDAYIPNRYEHGGVEDTYAYYRVIIDNMINYKNLPDSPLSKWTWFKQYLDAETDSTKQWNAV